MGRQPKRQKNTNSTFPGILLPRDTNTSSDDMGCAGLHRSKSFKRISAPAVWSLAPCPLWKPRSSTPTAAEKKRGKRDLMVLSMFQQTFSMRSCVFVDFFSCSGGNLLQGDSGLKFNPLLFVIFHTFPGSLISRTRALAQLGKALDPTF